MRDTGVGRMCLLPFFFRNASEPLHDNESMLERNETSSISLVSSETLPGRVLCARIDAALPFGCTSDHLPGYKYPRVRHNLHACTAIDIR
jgi:hypothetical protein